MATVTDRIIERSKPSRKRYLDLMAEEAEHGLKRPHNAEHGASAKLHAMEPIL
jgi:hypothetical protein